MIEVLSALRDQERTHHVNETPLIMRSDRVWVFLLFNSFKWVLIEKEKNEIEIQKIQHPNALKQAAYWSWSKSLDWFFLYASSLELFQFRTPSI